MIYHTHKRRPRPEVKRWRVVRDSRGLWCLTCQSNVDREECENAAEAMGSATGELCPTCMTGNLQEVTL